MILRIPTTRLRPVIKDGKNTSAIIPVCVVHLNGFIRDIDAKAGQNGPGANYSARLITSDGVVDTTVVFWNPPQLRQDIVLNKAYIVYNGRYKFSK